MTPDAPSKPMAASSIVLEKASGLDAGAFIAQSPLAKVKSNSKKHQSSDDFFD
jgi:hypothetical protein